MATVSEAVDKFLRVMADNPPIYTQLRWVDSSGMVRGISLYTVKDGEIVELDPIVSRILEKPIHKKGGIRVKGCGQNMAEHLVDLVCGVVYGTYTHSFTLRRLD